jgi:hypothetical protein
MVGSAAILVDLPPSRRPWETVDLKGKMLRPQHGLESLMAAVNKYQNKYQVTRLKLDCNQLGPEGGAKLAKALKTNTTLTLTSLSCACWQPSNRCPALAPVAASRGDPPSPLRAQPFLHGLDDSAKQAVRAAAGSRVELWLLDEQ